jgi:hypothetical protein
MTTNTLRDESVDAHEWQLQEAAFAQERQPVAGDGGIGVQHYRLLDRALRQAPASPLPADFAAALARRVLRERLLDGRWERRLLVLMLALLGLVGAALMYQHGGEWWAGWQQASPSQSRSDGGWLLLLGVVLAGSYAMRVFQALRSLSDPTESALK